MNLNLIISVEKSCTGITSMMMLKGFSKILIQLMEMKCLMGSIHLDFDNTFNGCGGAHMVGGMSPSRHFLTLAPFSNNSHQDVNIYTLILIDMDQDITKKDR